MNGRLQVNPGTHVRTAFSAENIAINDGVQQPFEIEFGKDLRLTDSDGQDTIVRVVAIVGQAALLPYRRG